MNWIALTGTATGNSDILSYDLYWDNASGTSSIELVNSLVTTYTVSGVSGGSTYKFKVRARNVYGYGSFSATELSVTPSDVPGKVAIAEVKNVGTNVEIKWTAPNSHSSLISKYEIWFKKSDGSFTLETTACDGSNAGISSLLTCTEPMTTLQTLTGLSVDKVIQVKIRAYNSNGWGDYSELNLGDAKIE